MKKISAARWLSFLLIPVSVTALPKGEQVIHGEADFHLDGSSYSITASDKTIISYESFNVGKQEHLRFLQPSKDATLLNRVVGSDPSQIFGNIYSNGKVFLINTHGVYFGKEAIVDTGSLVVSTLDILDQDFLEDRFSFRSKEGISGFIHNEGTLIASDGIVGLIAPQIKNEGTIRASLNKVLLAGAEAVTLTFSGDGLMSFEIEDRVKEGLIEHLGNIEANEVFIHLAKAKATIQTVINVDGLVDGNTLIQENGKVRITHESKIVARNAFIEGSKVSLEGEIDVSSETIGGTLHILGDHLELIGATIDASGELGGGTVLIGGEYKGQGDIRTALTNSMDETSLIKANALTNGNGGRVILWADDTTLFNGKIFAQGGEISGDGGFVETSGKKNLGITTGYVNTLAPFGKAGDWLLDPTTITIISSGTGTLANAVCTGSGGSAGAVTITAATINAAGSNVILCASTSITQNSSQTISMSTSGVGITFQGDGATITTTLNGNITTKGGAVAFQSTSVVLGADLTIDTTNATVPGASISFDSNSTLDGAHLLIFKSGTTGPVSFGANVGSTTPLKNLTFTGGSTITLGGNFTVDGSNVLTFIKPVILTNSPTIKSTNNSINFSSTINGAQALTINAGNGAMAFSGAIGGTTPLTNLIFSGSGPINIGGNITVTGTSTLSFPGNVSLTADSTLNTSTNNGNISFAGTINGGHLLNLNAGSGTITFSGAVGGTTPLSTLTFIGTTGSINIGANISAGNSPTFTFPNAVILTGTSTITASNTNGVLSFNSTIDGAHALTLTAQGTGTITLSGAVGGNTPLTNLTLSANPISIGNNITLTGDNPLTFPSAVTLTGSSSISFTPSSNSISFSSTIDATSAGSQTLALNTGSSGGLTFSGAVGGSTRLGAITISSSGTSTVSIGGNITANSFAITNAVPTALTGSSTIDTSANNGAISFGGSIDGNNSLTLASGSGTVTFATTVGGGTALSNLSFSGTTGTISVGGNITAGNSTLTFPGPVVLTHIADVNVSANNGNISFSSTVNGAFDLLLTAGTGTVAFSGAVGGTTPLTNLVFTSANLVQIGSNITISGTAATPLQFPAVSITGNSIITSSNSNGNITFSSTVDGASAGAQSLTINASSGAITFSGVVGGTTRLGALTLSSTAGTSSVSISNNISANSFTITNAVPTSLTANVIVNTSANNGNISFGGTINGAYDLNLTAGTGTVTFSGAVGGGTALTNLIFTSSAAIQVGASLTVSGANPLTFAQAVQLIGTSTITNSTNNITFNSTLNGAQALTIAGGSGVTTFSGAIGSTTALSSLSVTSATVTQGSTANITNALTYTGSTAINLGGNVTTSGGIITIIGPVVLSASSSIDSTNAGAAAAGAPINFTSTITGTVAGSQALTLNSGTAGSITFGGVIGSTRLGALLISSAVGTSSVSIGNNITANSFVITSAIPAIITGTSTIDTSANNGAITFGGTVNGAQSLTLNAGTNTVTLTGIVGGTTALSSLSATAATVTQSVTAKTTGALSYTGSTAINLGGNVTTSGGIINMTGPVVLLASPIIDTTNAGGTLAGASINFTSTINGAQTVTLTGGTTGTVTMTGAVGATTALTSLTATGATITQSSTSKATGAISYAGSMAINLGGNITTSGAVITLMGPVVLSASSTIDSTNAGAVAAGAAINFTSTITGTVAGSQALTLNSGTAGAITFGGVIGSTRLGALLISSAVGTSNVSIGNNITANSFVITSAVPAIITGTSTIDTSANNGAITFGGTVNGAQSLTLNAGTNTITFTGIVGGTTALSSLSATAATITQSVTAKTTGTLSYTGPTAINLGGNLTTSGAAITLTGPVVLVASSTIDTTNAGGVAAGAGINFTSTITGASAGSQALTLNSGTAGAITLGGVIGSTRLGGVLISSAAGTSSVSIGNNITANSFVITNAVPAIITGTSTINTSATNGAITFGGTVNGAQSLSLNAGTNTVTFTGNVGASTALNTLSATGGTVTQSGVAKTTGAFSYTGSTAINLNGNVTTSGSIITIMGPVVLSASSTIDSTNAGVVPAGAAINLTSTINGAQTLTLTGGTGGTVTMTGPVGATTPLASLTATGAVVTQGSTVKTTGAIGYTAPTAINLGGTITTSGAVITLTGPVVLSGPSTLDSTNAGGSPTGAAINFTSTIDGSTTGSQILTLNAGSSGAITLTGLVGGTTRLGAITVSSAAGTSTVSIGNNITANSFIITNAVPTTLTGSSIITTSANNGAISFGGTVDGTVAGAENLTLNAGANGTITLTGAIGATTRLGSLLISSTGGSVSIGSNITANSFTITNAVPAILTGSSLINTSASNGAISFGGTIDGTVAGAENLTLNAGTNGTITFTGAIGATTRLGSVLIASASAGSGSVTLGTNVTANSFTITNAVPAILTGSSLINTSASNGAISFGGTIDGTVAGAENLTLNAGSSGAITLTGVIGGTTRLGSFTISSTAGTSTVSISGNINANSFTVTNAVPALLTASSIINTSANNGAISFGGTIDATTARTQSLTLNAGSGSITFNRAIGATTVLGDLLISSTGGSVSIGANISANSFAIANSVPALLTASISIDTSLNNGQISFGGRIDGAQTLTLTAGTGNIAFTGIVGGTTPLTALNASGAAIIQSSALTTTGAVHYINTGLLTIGGTLAIGSLVQSGGGTVLLEANINSMTSIQTADPINFNTTVSLSATGIAGMLFDSPIIPTVDSAYDLSFTVTGGGITAPQLGSPSKYINTLTITAQNIVIPPLLIYAHTYNPHTAGTISANIIAPGAHLLFSTPTTVVSGTFIIDVTGGLSAGSVTFADTLDGPGGLTFDLGSGDLTFGSSIGSITPFGDLTISNANHVIIAGGFTGSSFTQTEGMGTTTVSGTITTTSSTGVSLNGAIALASSVTINTTTGNGNITFGSSSTIDGAEILSLNAGSATIFLGGPIGGTTPLINLVFGGAGLIETKSNIIVTGAHPLIFPDPLRIAGMSLILSNNADITFASTVDGSIDPIFNAGTGTVIFLGAIGSIIPIADLTVIAGMIDQTSSLTGSGSVNYINSGLATISGMISADSFTQSGEGSVLLESGITASSFIQLTAPIRFNTSLSLTANGPEGILFQSPIIPTSNRIYNVTLSAKNGSIIGPQLGSPTEYINRLVMRARFIDVPLIYANFLIEIIPTVFNPYFEYIPGIYTNYWKEKDTLSAPWYFDPGLITDQTVTPWKGSIWAL